MPKFIGNDIPGARQIQDNASAVPGCVRLQYSQAALLPENCVRKSLDTTDKGSRGSYAKRWYRWFGSIEAILRCEKSTPTMRLAALKALSALPTTHPVCILCFETPCTCGADALGDLRRPASLRGVLPLPED